MKTLSRMFVLVALLSGSASANAAPGLILSDVWTYAPPPGAANAAVFATIVNTGSEDEYLLSATSAAAEVSELHTMSMNDDGVMRMRHVQTLTVPAQSVLQLAPGGNHIMLMDIRPDVCGQPGSSFPMRLTFQQAGEKTVMVEVRSRMQKPGK